MHWRDRNNNRRTKVQLYWSSLTNAYSLKFENTYKWTQMQGVLTWIKQTIPQGIERDYDPELRTWYIHEKHLDKLKQLLELLSVDFELDFIPKPEGQASFEKFVPTEVYLQTFNKITGVSIDSLSVDEAKRVYRRTCMLLHPDKNPGRPDISSRIYDLNEAWSQLQIKHFKTKEVTQQL